MKNQIILFLLTLLAAACSSVTDAPNNLPSKTKVAYPPPGTPSVNQPPVNPFAPKPNDANLARGNVFIKESGLLIRESFPPQIVLFLSGELPTPCHELRVAVSPPDAENKIMVNAYSVVDPNMACTQVLEPFRENIELGTFPSGFYMVWMNGTLAGEFDS